MKTHLEIYNELYHYWKAYFVAIGFTEDQASRKANIIAVQNTHQKFCNQGK